RTILGYLGIPGPSVMSWGGWAFGLGGLVISRPAPFWFGPVFAADPGGFDLCRQSPDRSAYFASPRRLFRGAPPLAALRRTRRRAGPPAGRRPGRRDRGRGSVVGPTRPARPPTRKCVRQELGQFRQCVSPLTSSRSSLPKLLGTAHRRQLRE